MKNHHITTKDIVIGISASGTTPYVLGALQKFKKNKIITGSITCNKTSPISKISNYDCSVILTDHDKIDYKSRIIDFKKIRIDIYNLNCFICHSN